MSDGDYLHGYDEREQQRLVSQAAYWRDRLLLPGTSLAPGTRLLELGCGVGAVLGELGRAFPGIVLTGIDIEQRQIDFAREHLGRLGLEADLCQADGTALPFEDDSFDHVWTTWFLEHLADPVAALREARRVLVPGGRLTAVEVDYSTVRVEPSSAGTDALLQGLVAGMALSGRSDAGKQVGGWLREAGFTKVDPGERPFAFEGEAIVPEAAYFAEIWEEAIPSLATLPGAAPEPLLREGLAQLRGLHEVPGARLSWLINKATAVAA